VVELYCNPSTLPFFRQVVTFGILTGQIISNHVPVINAKLHNICI